MLFNRQVTNEIFKKTIYFDKDDMFGNKDIECTLVAYKRKGDSARKRETIKQRASKHDSVNDFNDKDMSGQIFLTWLLWFHLPGPDARYLHASASLDPNALWEIIKTLKSAQRTMKKLSKSNLDGEYSKKFESKKIFWNNPYFVVNSDFGDIYLSFWLASDGKYQYSRSFDLEETAKLTDSLYKVFDEGPRLVEQFRSIR